MSCHVYNLVWLFLLELEHIWFCCVLLGGITQIKNGFCWNLDCLLALVVMSKVIVVLTLLDIWEEFSPIWIYFNVIIHSYLLSTTGLKRKKLYGYKYRKVRTIIDKGKGLVRDEPVISEPDCSEDEGDNWPGMGLADRDYSLKGRVQTESNLKWNQSTGRGLNLIWSLLHIVKGQSVTH